MLVVIQYPFVLKQSRVEELETRYAEMLNKKNAVLIVDSCTKVSIYHKENEEPIEVKIVDGEDPEILGSTTNRRVNITGGAIKRVTTSEEIRGK